MLAIFHRVFSMSKSWLEDNKKSPYNFAGDVVRPVAKVLLACAKQWMCDMPTKAVVLAWRLLINQLPTREALRRGVALSLHYLCCVLCFCAEETANHLFCNCLFIMRVWEKISTWMTPFLHCQEPLAQFLHFGQILKGRKLKATKHLIWMATT